MTLLTMLLIAWAVLTAVLIVLLIYRSTLVMHEDDQLFLNDSESHMQKEQSEVIDKLNKVQPLVRVFGSASALLILVIAAMAIWQALNAVQ
jgi:hypothetical protein